MMICCTCKKEKPFSDFHKNSKNKNGYSKMCKECKSISDKKSHLKYKEKRNKKSTEYYEKNRDYFLELNIKYNKENKEKLKIARNKFYEIEENKEKLKEQKKKYYLNNKEKINNDFKNRRRTDLAFRLKNNMRARMYHALKGNHKKSSTFDYIGITFEEFKLYIYKMFREGMSWENYGKVWHIDHIIPCYNFDFTNENEIKKCFHYSNLQPLFAIENMKKNKYDSIKQ